MNPDGTSSADTPRREGVGGSAAAARAIWDWRRSEDRVAPEVARASALRKSGVIRGVIGAILGIGVYFFLHHTLAYVVWAIAGITLVSALLSPTGLYRRIDRLVELLGTAIGRVLGWILMPILFYLVILPFGLVARRGRKDRLERWYEPGAQSYWKPHAEVDKGDEPYERQF